MQRTENSMICFTANVKSARADSRSRDLTARIFSGMIIFLTSNNALLPMNAEHRRIERPSLDHISVIVFLLLVWGLALLCIGIGLSFFDRPDLVRGKCVDFQFSARHIGPAAQ